MEAGVSVAPFLGPVWVAGRSVVVPEEGFGLFREELGELYRQCREFTPGGFTVKVGEYEWLGPDYWDDVLPLTRSLQQALQSLRTLGGAVFWLPDQPVRVTMRRDEDRLHLMLATASGPLGPAVVCHWPQFAATVEQALHRLEQFLVAL